MGQNHVGLELHGLHAISGDENRVAVVNLRLVRADKWCVSDERRSHQAAASD